MEASDRLVNGQLQNERLQKEKAHLLDEIDFFKRKIGKDMLLKFRNGQVIRAC